MSTVLKLYADSRAPGVCRSCGAEIEWAELISGKRHPFNRPLKVITTTPDFLPPDGRREVLRVDAGYSHFATCPQAKSWTRGQRK